MEKGGYKLIDLQDVDITIDGDGVNIPGTFDSIERNWRKPCVVTGLTMDGVERADRWVNFRYLDNAFVGIIGFNDSYIHLMLRITSDDMVTVFNM